ncbi:MAG: hypothetical protein ISS57_02695 [Anaerolineales bacterium]|nr:hypothetical protein [Chloroflexota bacterium]MBL7161486.1 hypothetical protein [Anaerolineales bacterium]
MRKTLHLNIPSFVLILVLLLVALGMTACQSADEAAPAADEPQQSQPAQQPSDDSGDELVEGSDESPSVVEDAEPEPESASEPDPVDPAAIEAAWVSSPHADAFVLDVAGNNNTCAQCHAPVNWLPSMDDLPESCFACKFELEDPPPLIPESEWVSIPCNVCHKVDKKDNILPEYAWLEIAPLGEYAEVATTTELCQKCHREIDLPEHELVQLGAAHADYVCTDCHNAHDTMASCGAVDCHADADVIEPATPLAGHDEDHQLVSCVACHDADGLEVGLSEDLGLWTTFAQGSSGEGAAPIAYASHNIVLEAPCERCHFADNPWGLSDSISAP